LQGFERPALAGLGVARAINQGLAAAVQFILDDEVVEPRARLQPARQRQLVRIDQRRVGFRADNRGRQLS
jgi:hypothetical protein